MTNKAPEMAEVNRAQQRWMTCRVPISAALRCIQRTFGARRRFDTRRGAPLRRLFWALRGMRSAGRSNEIMAIAAETMPQQLLTMAEENTRRRGLVLMAVSQCVL